MAVNIEHLNKTLGGRAVLRDVSLRINDGEIVGLLGPNGAGKSTLMKIMVGLWRPDGVTQATPSAPKIGYLPENNPLYEDMYVREYLRFIRRIQHTDDDIEAAIDRVGLRPEAHKKIGQLSKGYRQRVGLAQALMGKPDLLILDEPTTGLDPNQLVEIRALIHAEKQHASVILSTHILQEVKALCDRVIIIDHGQIKADRSVNDTDDLEQLFRKCTQGIENGE